MQMEMHLRENGSMEILLMEVILMVMFQLIIQMKISTKMFTLYHLLLVFIFYVYYCLYFNVHYFCVYKIPGSLPIDSSSEKQLHEIVTKQFPINGMLSFLSYFQLFKIIIFLQQIRFLILQLIFPNLLSWPKKLSNQVHNQKLFFNFCLLWEH